MFEFSSLDQLSLILCQGPSSYGKVHKGDTPSSVDLTCVDFWVHIFYVPFEWHTKKMGFTLGESVDLVVDVDVSGPSFHLRISCDVTKPLCRVLYVD